MSAIQTFTGRWFDLAAPDPAQVDVVDVAHSLSQINRYTGHTTRPYSVAQHCVLISRIVPETLAFDALMHDAAEAYVGDLSRPLRMLLPEFDDIEHRVRVAVGAALGFDPEISAQVRDFDTLMLFWERRDLLVRTPQPWVGEGDYDSRIPSAPIRPWLPSAAERLFLERYAELTSQAAA